MKITVTQGDIATAKERLHSDQNHFMTSQNCPVALAVKRATWAKFASVDGDSVWIAYNVGDKVHSGPVRDLPKDVQLFIQQFDARLEVAPFEFELEQDLKW